MVMVMALSAVASSSLAILHRLQSTTDAPAVAASVRLLPPYRRPPTSLCSRNPVPIRATASAAPAVSGSFAPAISVTEKALNHLVKMRAERNEDLCLRIGVKQGGCSGMSYTMDFENRANTSKDDSIMEYDGFTIVCDPKSLLFVYGMQLDFSEALIGGGFSFKNPNATKTCGCGKSFAAEGAELDVQTCSSGN